MPKIGSGNPEETDRPGHCSHSQAKATRPQLLVRRIPQVQAPDQQTGRQPRAIHACNFALQLWGDKTITDEVHKICLDLIDQANGWLDMGRKRPVPHESWFAVAGYFFTMVIFMPRFASKRSIPRITHLQSGAHRFSYPFRKRTAHGGIFLYDWPPTIRHGHGPAQLKALP